LGAQFTLSFKDAFGLPSFFRPNWRRGFHPGARTAGWQRRVAPAIPN